ncbi:hypothetical protein C2857_003093 [Epichloe festucae Fl1]|uniref:Uncharacterized protein n=1 Tax=Epichloe festucae (strain Fl1) TaxID=877507 RepID=A0A7S9KUN8_EPIFF|nr:hypothetical protein C2857_003093 [Epichloe festucae Fl1]
MDPPPSYDDVANPTIDDDDSRPLTPATFHILGSFIYSDRNPTGEPLYELSHQIDHLRDTTRSMSINRLDSTSRVQNGTSRMVTRKRHIYDLKHPGILTGPLFLYHADSVSRYSLCSFGVCTVRKRRLFSSAHGFQVHRAVKDAHRDVVPRGHLFSVASTRRGKVRFEWSDPGGEIIARELDSPLEKHSLFITMEMNEMARDALVTAWVLRVWWQIARSPRYEL